MKLTSYGQSNLTVYLFFRSQTDVFFSTKIVKVYSARSRVWEIYAARFSYLPDVKNAKFLQKYTISDIKFL